MMIIKIIGYILILWGIADLGLSYLGTDIWWNFFGIDLEGIYYSYSFLPPIIIGALLTQISKLNN